MSVSARDADVLIVVHARVDGVQFFDDLEFCELARHARINAHKNNTCFCLPVDEEKGPRPEAHVDTGRGVGH